jgi:Tfp pilus assembly PilM family ATPase
LVGLSRQSHDLAKVHTSVSLEAAGGLDASDLGWLSQHLRQQGRSRGGSRDRLNMALPAAQLREGFIDFPANLPEQEWQYEVLLEVSQALQLAPDEVSFDFEPAPSTHGLVQRVHWMGCSQARMSEFKSCTRAAGWRLAAVESEIQAAQRGVRALQGGVASLLTQSPQDWQFRLSPQMGSIDDGMPKNSDVNLDPDADIEQAVQRVLATSAGPRLVASGLALKAWQ